MTEQTIGVTEAARRMDRSVAVVRQLCAKGLIQGAYRLPAERDGRRSWVIPVPVVRLCPTCRRPE